MAVRSAEKGRGSRRRHTAGGGSFFFHLAICWGTILTIVRTPGKYYLVTEWTVVLEQTGNPPVNQSRYGNPLKRKPPSRPQSLGLGSRSFRVSAVSPAQSRWRRKRDVPLAPSPSHVLCHISGPWYRSLMFISETRHPHSSLSKNRRLTIE